MILEDLLYSHLENKIEPSEYQRQNNELWNKIDKLTLSMDIHNDRGIDIMNKGTIMSEDRRI